ncbi:MAG: histidine kinase N-terminal 7TM domain-containing protein [Candidatus Marinimicrobia bacterium]|nr:histidine kinase N-terminal 7TM domain-containing protein [Candidatus Neomarinimicrobiota bacterium]
MSLIVTPFFIPMIAAIGVCLLVLMYAIRHRETTGSPAFILLMGSITFWQIAYMIWLLALNPSVKVLFDKISYIGVVFVAPGWLFFAFQYSGERVWWSLRRVAIILVIPLIILLLAWTNEYHWLIWRDYDFYPAGNILLQNVHYGPGFWALTAYSYFLLLIGSLIIIKTVLHASPFYRRQAFFLLAGVAFPWLGNILYVFKIVDIPGLDLTPFMLGISGVLVGVGLYFFRLLSIVPIARKALIEGTDDGLLIMDGNNRIVDLNPACRKILNIKVKNVIGELINNVWSGNLSLLGKYIDVMKLHTEIQVGNSGETIFYNLRIQPLYKDNGIFLGRLITLRDTTELRKAQMKKNRIQKLETIEIMAGGIAHDFNNHLSIIDGNLKLIELAYADGKDISKYIGKIYGASQKAGTVTKQLLTFTKGIEPQKELIEIPEFLNELADLLLSASKANYTVDIPENLWAVNADKDLLGQVFSNLIINADQAMPGGGTIEFQCSNIESDAELPDMLNPENQYVRIKIRDQGIGIPRDQMIKIFDPYFTTKQKGSGLGLAISFAIIQKHDGYISVESTVGQGTVFTVYLPAVTNR